MHRCQWNEAERHAGCSQSVVSAAITWACFCGEQVCEPCMNASFPCLDCQCIISILHGPPCDPGVISLELMLDVAIRHIDTDRHIQARHITCTDTDIDHAAAYSAPGLSAPGLSAFTTTTKPHHIHSFCRLNRHSSPNRAYHPSQQSWAGYQMHQIVLIKLLQRKHPACPFWL